MLLRDWAAAELGLTRIEILAHRDNGASQRVAERAGFTRAGEPRPPPARHGLTDGEPVFLAYAWSPS